MNFISRKFFFYFLAAALLQGPCGGGFFGGKPGRFLAPRSDVTGEAAAYAIGLRSSRELRRLSRRLSPSAPGSTRHFKELRKILLVEEALVLVWEFTRLVAIERFIERMEAWLGNPVEINLEYYISALQRLEWLDEEGLFHLSEDDAYYLNLLSRREVPASLRRAKLRDELTKADFLSFSRRQKPRLLARIGQLTAPLLSALRAYSPVAAESLGGDPTFFAICRAWMEEIHQEAGVFPNPVVQDLQYFLDPESVTPAPNVTAQQYWSIRFQRMQQLLERLQGRREELLQPAAPFAQPPTLRLHPAIASGRAADPEATRVDTIYLAESSI